MAQDETSGQIVRLPREGRSAVEIALDELEHISAFVYRRVGNRADAEELVQEVALRAVPRLRRGVSRLHPCHGARFGTDGRSLTAGYRLPPLPRVQVRIEEGRMEVLGTSGDRPRSAIVRTL